MCKGFTVCVGGHGMLEKEHTEGARGGWENHQTARQLISGKEKEGIGDRKSLQLQGKVKKVPTKPMESPGSQVAHHRSPVSPRN